MNIPASPPPGVYHSRSRVTRNRAAYTTAGLALVLLGYLIGRLQDSPETAAAATPVAAVVSAAPPVAPSAEPTPSVSPAPGGTDAYSVLQAEDAAGQQGVETEDTGDEGGGRNVGWISNGDWLRFDDVDFGDIPATRFLARLASESDEGGRIEVHIDSPGNDPAATLATEDTGGWQDFRTQGTELSPTTGRHTVFLVFARDDDEEFMNLNYFSFLR